MTLDEELRNIKMTNEELFEKGVEVQIEGDLYAYATYNHDDDVHIFVNYEDGYLYHKQIPRNKFIENKYFKYDITKNCIGLKEDENETNK